MTTDFYNTDDVIDVRDIIERFEELESAFDDAMEEVPDNERGNMENAAWKKWADSEDAEEFKKLQSLLDELKGNGGDEQWRGDWYPITLIHESYFTDYAEELCKDIGEIPSNLPWYIANHINWEGVASEIKVDYFSVDFDGEEYWTR